MPPIWQDAAPFAGILVLSGRYGILYHKPGVVYMGRADDDIVEKTIDLSDAYRKGVWNEYPRG